MMIFTASGYIHQVIAGFAACLGALACGAATSWITPYLPKLLSSDSEIPMTYDEVSLLNAMPYLGCLLSPIPAGFLADRVGRKTVIMATGPLFLVGWINLLCFKTLAALYISKVVQGVGTGIICTVLPMYLGEIATPKYRGVIVCLYHLCWNAGSLFEFIIGPLLSFTTMIYVTALTNVIFIVAFLRQPESPYYYLLKNDINRAEKSLTWLIFSSKEEITAKIVQIKLFIEQERSNKVTYGYMLLNQKIRKSMTILMLSGFLNMFCGFNTLSIYSTETLKLEKHFFIISPDSVTFTMGVMTVIGSTCSYFTLDFFGRKVSLLFGCLLTGLCMFMVGTFYLLKQHTSLELSFLSWVPSVGLIIIPAVSSMGIFPVTAAYQSELFDTSTRAKASSILIMFTSILGILPDISYLSIKNSIGLYANFYIFALCCFFGAVLSLTVMPETTGKSFEQIKDDL